MDNKNSSDYNLINLIQKTPLFSKLDEAACQSLLPYLEHFTLKQGEILFHQGDPSDSLYILLDGQLIATLAMHSDEPKKIIGTIEKGETVGELGALSNQPRALGLHAAIDSQLLKFPRAHFHEFIKTHPAIISHIIEIIINRSQNTIKLISQKKLYQHVAVIRGNDSVSLDTLMVKLRKNFPDDNHFILIEKVLNNAEILQKIENEGKSAVFILDLDNITSLRSILNHIGGVYIVVNGDKSSKLSSFALDILQKSKTPFATQYELILLHDDSLDMPQGTRTWLDQAQFTLHHHIRMNDDSGYQKLWRFMRGKAVGLVLGGGGVKGWVSVGAIKSLEENNIPIDMIGGTSAGSALGACYARDLSYEKARKTYQIIAEPGNNPFVLKNFTWPFISLLSAKKVTEVLQETFGNLCIEDLWMYYFAVSSNLNKSKEHVHKTGYVWKCIRSSVAIPGIIPPMVIEDELHYDGGLLNNLPVDVMRTLMGNDSTIIAVSLSRENNAPQKYYFPPAIPFRVGLLKKFRLGYHNYIFPPFLNTFIKALLLGASTKERINQLKANVLIAPDLSDYNALDLTFKKIDQLTEIGYKSTNLILKKNV